MIRLKVLIPFEKTLERGMSWDFPPIEIWSPQQHTAAHHSSTWINKVLALPLKNIH